MLCSLCYQMGFSVVNWVGLIYSDLGRSLDSLPVSIQNLSPNPPWCNLVFVEELIYNQSWNVPLVKSLFSEFEFNAIIDMPLSIWDISDRLIWHFDKNGCYSVKIAYQVG
ncbi:hypothetical protein ACFX1Z_024746 [Malus domestica]